MLAKNGTNHLQKDSTCIQELSRTVATVQFWHWTYGNVARLPLSRSNTPQNNQEWSKRNNCKMNNGNMY